ncbi:MAG: 30S ribosomal protein S7 [Bacteroidaceae bacterium]|nr:30S ribosomal protein S7 [Bacteroidaceae bacterium]
MVSVAFKNRTRDEVIAAFRESIRKKNEWIKESDEEFKRIREERRQLAL